MAKPAHVAVTTAFLCSLTMLSVSAQDEAQALAGDSALLATEVMPEAPSSLLLDAVQTGDSTLIVGERGHVLISRDGETWRQVEGVPTRSTLTAVTAVGEKVWAVGHDGVIIHSADAGQSWVRQRADPRPPESLDPDQGRPLLDVLFVDADHGFVIGAYALMLETRDGGQTWIERTLDADASASPDAELSGQADADADAAWLFSDDELELEAEENPHLNAIVQTPGGRLLIAGERGAAYRSSDGGESWQRLSLPYEGSMFGVLAWSDDHVMVFGLRGNVLESFDFGDTWQTVDSSIEASLMGGMALPDGGAVLVGAEGRMIARDRTGQPFRLSTFANEAGETPILADALPLADGEYLVFGERGIGRHRPQ